MPNAVPPPEEPDFFSSLKARTTASRRARKKQLAEDIKSARLREATTQALRRMAHGTAEEPIGDELHDKIHISPLSWAKLIKAAVRALARCPRLDSVRSNPLEVHGLGYEAAEHVWKLALAGEPAARIARAISKSLRHLGYCNEWPQSNPRYRDSSNAFWGYFKALELSFDGATWRPSKTLQRAPFLSNPSVPENERPAAVPISREPSKKGRRSATSHSSREPVLRHAPKQLSDCELECLAGLLELSAVDRARRKSSIEVAKKTRSVENAAHVKDCLGELVRRRLARSVRGPHGGYWLTKSGVTRAQRTHGASAGT